MGRPTTLSRFRAELRYLAQLSPAQELLTKRNGASNALKGIGKKYRYVTTVSLRSDSPEIEEDDSLLAPPHLHHVLGGLTRNNLPQAIGPAL